MTGWYHKWISVVLTAALLAGCSKEANLPDKSEDSAGDVYVHFRMELHNGGIPGGTRAEGTPTTPGTAREDAVNTVDLLVCDAASGCLFAHIPLNRQQIEQIKGTDGVFVPITIPKGRTVHVYAAVNMTERMRQLFRIGESGRDLALASSGNDYWDVINEFVPGSNGLQETLETVEGGGIPMTGQFKIDATSGEEIGFDKAHATKENALPVTAEVSRIVAKVHVLARGDSDGYAISNAGDERLGWIHLDDIRYMVNGSNKSTYLIPQPNDKDGAAYPWRDPNMDLESYMAGGFDLDMGFDAPAWTKDYVFYNGLSLHKENIAAASRLSRVDPFDQTTYDNTKGGTAEENRYTQGMYCLENYFDTPVNATAFENYDEAIPMVTHVSVAAKLTPQWIVLTADYAQKMAAFIKEYEKEDFLAGHGLTTADFTADDVARWNAIRTRYDAYFTDAQYLYGEGDSFRFIKTENEADAADLLNWSLKVNGLWSRNPNDFEHDKYPDGTFYVYDLTYDAQAAVPNKLEWKQKYLYLSAGAVTTATADNINIKTYSVPHIGGWGYYYTYLDQLRTAQNGRTPYTASQVTRNTYYLITVGNFGVPGGSTSRPEYIRVNTEPVGWDYDGKGDIDLH